MASIDSRLTKLERADPPAVVRPAGESFEEFFARMGVALSHIYRADPFDEDEHSRAIEPWLAAMTHVELTEVHDALEQIQAGRAASRKEKP